MFITSQIFQGSEWVTGGNHHWDQYRIGTFDGTTFTPEVSARTVDRLVSEPVLVGCTCRWHVHSVSLHTIARSEVRLA